MAHFFDPLFSVRELDGGPFRRLDRVLADIQLYGAGRDLAYYVELLAACREVLAILEGSDCQNLEGDGIPWADNIPGVEFVLSALVRALFVAKHHRRDDLPDLRSPMRPLELTVLCPLLLASLARLRTLRPSRFEAIHWWADLVRMDDLGPLWLDACDLVRPLRAEMLLRFPSVLLLSRHLSFLYGYIRDRSRTLDMFPLWLADFAGVPYLLVSLVHLCRRVGMTRDEPDLWRALRKDSCNLLQLLVHPSVSPLRMGDPTLAWFEYAQTVGDRRILGRLIGDYTLVELETGLPFCSDEDSVALARDISMRDYYNPTRDFPFDCWAPYGGFDMSDAQKRSTVSTVLAEYFELRSFLCNSCPGAYARFRHSLVDLRNRDMYPFPPVAVDLEEVDWNFQAEEEAVVPTISRDGHLSPNIDSEGRVTF